MPTWIVSFALCDALEARSQIGRVQAPEVEVFKKWRRSSRHPTTPSGGPCGKSWQRRNHPRRSHGLAPVPVMTPTAASWEMLVAGLL